MSTGNQGQQKMDTQSKRARGKSLSNKVTKRKAAMVKQLSQRAPMHLAAAVYFMAIDWSRGVGTVWPSLKMVSRVFLVQAGWRKRGIGGSKGGFCVFCSSSDLPGLNGRGLGCKASAAIRVSRGTPL